MKERMEMAFGVVVDFGLRLRLFAVVGEGPSLSWSPIILVSVLLLLIFGVFARRTKQREWRGSRTGIRRS